MTHIVIFYDPGDDNHLPFTVIAGPFSKLDADTTRGIFEDMFKVTFSIIPMEDIDEYMGTGEKINRYGMPERLSKLSLIMGGKNDKDWYNSRHAVW